MSSYSPDSISRKIHGLMSAPRATMTAAHPALPRGVGVAREEDIAVADHGNADRGTTSPIASQSAALR